VNDIDAQLGRIRGDVPPLAHNARSIAALTSNPGCARRAIMDAAGIDKPRLASYIGFPAPFGQSQFAITRGNAFEAQVKANGCAELLRLLREQLGLPIELATSRHATRASSTASGSAPPAKVAPTAIDSATAPAGAMEVIDWNRTSRRPMAPLARPVEVPAELAAAMPAPFAEEQGSVSGISGRLAIPEVPANKVINLDLRFCKGQACPELRPWPGRWASGRGPRC
jgi:hypothetical protein